MGTGRQKYGLLTVLFEERVKGERTKFRCVCDCGNEVSIIAKAVKNGNTKSCGCLAKKKLVERNKANSIHGMSNSPEFTAWTNMKDRCLNPNHNSFDRYGGRGIKVCQRWLDSFAAFYEDMGKRPDGLTLDRENVHGDYEPGNCRWATDEQQANNRENNRFLEFEGVKKTLSQWAKQIGISKEALRHRVNSGWKVKDALTMKTNHGNGWVIGTRGAV